MWAHWSEPSRLHYICNVNYAVYSIHVMAAEMRLRLLSPPMTGTDLDQQADTPSVKVVDAVAAATGTDPLDLYPPLFNVIDPGALDRLFRDDAEAVVTFTYNGCRVRVVNDDGEVDVDVVIDGRR